jgi:nucleoside-diphosphate-sugar epimerase
MTGLEPTGGLPAYASDVVMAMQQVLPPGVDCTAQTETLGKLQGLTSKLIDCYRSAGKLADDPFGDMRDRQIHLHEAEISSLITGRRVLVTGGAGCVGRVLLRALQRLRPSRLVCVDRAPALGAEFGPNVVHHRLDVRNAAGLGSVFELERPNVVFHLAAQRDPGLAERLVHETLSTNIIGCANVIDACEEYGAEVCVFSSTGKASRYLTLETYAASKKFAEWQFQVAARTGRTRYAVARFTHVLDNSLVCGQLDAAIAGGVVVGVHAPGRMIVAQNANEATHLLLNASIFASNGRLPLLVVRNLGWPIETLEIALYRLVQSGSSIPVRFLGIPPGYAEDFFRGQVDWRFRMDLHTLLNVLESPGRRFDSARDMILTELEELNPSTCRESMTILREAICDSSTPEALMRAAVSLASMNICEALLRDASVPELLNILHWGLGPKSAGPEALRYNFPPIVAHLVHALNGRVTAADIQASVMKPGEFEDLCGVLEKQGFGLRVAEPRRQAAADNGAADAPSMRVA